jgi:hypothetical protein
VLAKGDITVSGLTFTPASSTNAILNASSSCQAAGCVDATGSTADRWLKYGCGTGAHLLTTTGAHIFSDTLNGMAVTDYIAQCFNGDLGSSYSPVTHATNLTGSFLVSWASGTSGSPGTTNVYCTTPPTGSTVYPVGYGAFTQNCSTITSRVTDITSNTLDYTTWKTFAAQHGRYCRPNAAGTQFFNNGGFPLYVKPNASNSLIVDLTTNPAGATTFTSLLQLSMLPLVPANGNIDTNPGSLLTVADQYLFIDSPEGTKGGTQKTYTFNSSDGFFWKGVLYVNGRLSLTGGGGSPSIRVKSPTEYSADSYGTTTGRLVSSCFLDGVLVTNGISTVGSAAIYGSLVSNFALDRAVMPDVYFNSRSGPVVDVASVVIPDVPVQMSMFVAD